ncbi:hypothetical protein BGX28_008968 [Mortierella sp. GBA30]|nr:hypothetical protein BGX28_008968 [Mortierella sp. GBA30]
MDNYNSNNSSNNSTARPSEDVVMNNNDLDNLEDTPREESHHRRSSYHHQNNERDFSPSGNVNGTTSSHHNSKGESVVTDSRDRRESQDRRSRTGSRSQSRDRYREDKYDSERRRSSYDQHHRDHSNTGRAARSSRSRSPVRGSATGGGSSRDRRVYVGNLSYDVRWTDLKDFMREIGPVAHADVLLSADGRSKGCGVVEFHRAEHAKDAIRKLNDVMLMGRPVFVREDRESEGRIGFSGGRSGTGGGGSGFAKDGDSTCQVYVGNLPYSVNWKDMKDLFRRAGPVTRADVFQTNDMRSKGSGTVIFDRTMDVSRAISMFNGYEWHGRRIEVREDKYGPPAGGRGSSYGHSNSDYRHESSSGRDRDRDRDHGRDRGRERERERDRQHDMYDGGSRGYGNNDISMDMVPSGPAAGSGDQIYIRNLPLTTTEQDLRDLFRTCGSIRMTEILLHGGRPKGSGIVRFELFESADKAVAKFNGYVYGGRPLEIMYDRA